MYNDFRVKGEKKDMKFYNVTFNLADNRDILTPCIPDSAGTDEDKTIPRVCLTDSIEHCIQAIATGNREVYKGAQFIVREADIKSDEKLVHPRFLKELNYVPDALENNEYWYLNPIKVKRYICKIESFDYEFELAWSCISRKQCLDAIGKYMSIKRFVKYKTSKGIYNAFCRYCTEHKKWDWEDSIWEDLAMLPWAQTTKIYNLKYKVIKQF